MSKKKVFLLGGYDLEMLEIKKILDSENVEYKDKNLSWENANLSAYEQELELYNDDSIIYGIELEIDMGKGKKTLVQVDEEGHIKLETRGFKGKACTEETQFLKDYLVQKHIVN